MVSFTENSVSFRKFELKSIEAASVSTSYHLAIIAYIILTSSTCGFVRMTGYRKIRIGK